MPPALLSHVSESATTDKSGQMDGVLKGHRIDPALCPTDDDAVALKRRTPEKRSLEYVWRSGLAGGLAGCAAKSVVAPLDRVKILFQASNPQFAKYTGSWFGVVSAVKDIFHDEGTFGLYRGHSATLLRIFPYAAIKFVAYEQIRALIIRRADQETPFRRLISGSLAGVTSVFFTYPLEVIRVRLAFETRKDSRSSFSQIIKHIYHEHPPLPRPSVPSIGISANASTPARAAQAIATSTIATVQAITPRAGLVNFYRGFSATLMGMVPYAGVSFLTHDLAHDALRHPLLSPYTTLPPSSSLSRSQNTNKPPPLRSWAELLSGGLAGLVSQTASYPLEIIRRRMQVGGAVGDGHRLRVAETAALIWRERGFSGFWVGLGIGYVKVVPMVAVSFYVYERAKAWLGI